IMSGLSRIQDIMEIPSSTEGTHTLNKAESHKVLFEHVTFRYDKTDVLKDVNIELPAETVTAFVGASGAGKTTAAQLVPKFWEVSEGAIRIDGKNINSLKTEN